MRPFVVYRFLIVALILLGVGYQSAESTLWDLIIYAQIENQPLFPDTDPIITGIVQDHSSKPVSGAQVELRIFDQTIMLTTDNEGKFHHTIVNLNLLPGMYVVNIKAQSDDGKIGFGTTSFQVKGKVSPYSYTAQLLQTPQALKYLNAKPADFQNDPLGMSIYTYYQKLQDEYQKQVAKQKEIEIHNMIIANQRALAQNITQQIIKEKNPGAGIYSGFNRDVFVANLDQNVKSLIEAQLNYTVDVFYAAKKAMNDVLLNGGTMEEARKVYFEKAAIPRKSMLTLTEEQVNQTITNSTILNATGLIPNNLNKTDEQPPENSYVYINVNGTIYKFLINGTDVIPVNNSNSTQDGT